MFSCLFKLSKAKFFGLILGLCLLAFTPVALVHAVTIVELQAQIQSVLARVAMAQQQWSELAWQPSPAFNVTAALAGSLVKSGAGAPPYIEGEVLVTFKLPDGGTAMSDEQSLDSKAQDIEKSFDINNIGKSVAYRTVLFKTEKNESTKDLINRMDSNVSIESIQPNYIYKPTAQEIPWGISREQGINAVSSWASTQLPSFYKGVTGEGVVVAVIDTGVDYTHEDLAQNIWKNPGEDCSNGVDDDGNGFVDDCRGWNFASENNDVKGVSGHGTHVAGIIAAQNNNIGVVGVAPDAKIMPIQVFLGGVFTSSFLVAQGINYAGLNHAKVINLSLGAEYDGPYEDVFLKRSIQQATNAGITVIAAAGNSGKSGKRVMVYPAALPGVIAVGAVDGEHSKTDFSNIGNWIDVVAPGLFINSTLPNNSYGSHSGTSMASPHVAGVVALLLQKYPNISPFQIEMVLRSYTVDLGTSGRDDYYGYGFVNAYKLLSANISSILSAPVGTIRFRAILNGNDVSGKIALDVTSPDGNITRGFTTDLPASYVNNNPAGAYTVTISPENDFGYGIELASESSTTQVLSSGEDVTFTFIFRSSEAVPVTTGTAEGLGDLTNTHDGGYYCPSLTLSMNRGTSGERVRELQKFLASYYAIDTEELVTGFFGKITQSYVQKFQRANGLTTAYGVGPQTRAKIAEVCSKTVSISSKDIKTTDKITTGGVDPYKGSSRIIAQVVDDNGKVIGQLNGVSFKIKYSGPGGSRDSYSITVPFEQEGSVLPGSYTVAYAGGIPSGYTYYGYADANGNNVADQVAILDYDPITRTVPIGGLVSWTFNFKKTSVSTSYMPTCNLIAEPSSIKPGESSKLKIGWMYTKSFSIDQGIGVVATSTLEEITPANSPAIFDGIKVTPSVTTTYTGTAVGSEYNGSATCLATVKVIGAQAVATSRGNNAEFVSQSQLPSTMTPGQTATVKITMKNTGSTTWTWGENYRLGAVNDNPVWGTNRISLGNINYSQSVVPGATHTFTAYITAPSVNGVYNFQWKMLRENIEWFGDTTINIPVKVSQSAQQTYTHYTTGQWSTQCTGDNTQIRTVSAYTNTTPPNEEKPVSSRACELQAPAVVSTYTHYTTGAWSACAYQINTGYTQTRTVTPYTNTTAPNESAPVTSQSCTVGNGTLKIRATLNGNQISTGNISIDYTSPVESGTGYTVHVGDNLTRPAGNYTINYNTGNVTGSGITFSNITPSVNQTLLPGNDITYTFNFSCASGYSYSNGSCVANAAQTYTHYTTGAWSACTYYAGVGNQQTRTVTQYTNTTAPNESAPAASQACTGTGHLRFRAVLNGNQVTVPWKSKINITLNGTPRGAYDVDGTGSTFSNGIHSYLNNEIGTYTIEFATSGQYDMGTGVSFSGITPSATQVLNSGGDITFTLNFAQ